MVIHTRLIDPKNGDHEVRGQPALTVVIRRLSIVVR